MTAADLNQLTIAGYVRREPELREFPDGESSCSFVLTHTSEHPESGHWELQFYDAQPDPISRGMRARARASTSLMSPQR
jgi:primosomal replication protein N